MFFILSKILAFLLCPAYWIYIGVVLYFFSKRPNRKKGILIATLSITFLFTNKYIFQKVMLWWQTPKQVIQNGTTYEAGILLGGLYSFDNDNIGYFNDNSDRFIQTNKLYQEGIIKKIIISGGSAAILSKEPLEADSLKKEFVLSGVKVQDIIIDHSSRNTYENALFTKRLTDSLHLKPPFALVTSAFHMPRSLMVFKKQNINVVPVTSSYIIVNKTLAIDQLILPNPKVLSDWEVIIKEWIGIMMYKLTGKA